MKALRNMLIALLAMCCMLTGCVDVAYTDSDSSSHSTTQMPTQTTVTTSRVTTTATKLTTTTTRQTTTATEKITTQHTQENEVLVWIPATGAKYHRKASCSNMKDPSQVSLSEAERLGYTPCKRCY